MKDLILFSLYQLIHLKFDNVIILSTVQPHLQLCKYCFQVQNSADGFGCWFSPSAVYKKS